MSLAARTARNRRARAAKQERIRLQALRAGLSGGATDGRRRRDRRPCAFISDSDRDELDDDGVRSDGGFEIDEADLDLVHSADAFLRIVGSMDLSERHLAEADSRAPPPLSERRAGDDLHRLPIKRHGSEAQKWVGQGAAAAAAAAAAHGSEPPGDEHADAHSDTEVEAEVDGGTLLTTPTVGRDGSDPTGETATLLHPQESQTFSDLPFLIRSFIDDVSAAGVLIPPLARKRREAVTALARELGLLCRTLRTSDALIPTHWADPSTGRMSVEGRVLLLYKRSATDYLGQSAAGDNSGSGAAPGAAAAAAAASAARPCAQKRGPRDVLRAPTAAEALAAAQRAAATPSIVLAERDAGNFGWRMLRLQGWSGGGLGRDGTGIAEPVLAVHVPGRRGLGAE